jgi:uncharacterized membrane protein
LETLEGRALPGETLFGALLAFDLGARLSQADALWGPVASLPSPLRIWSAPVPIASLVGVDMGHGKGQPYAPVSTAQEYPDQVGRNPPALVGAGTWFAVVLPAQGSVGEQPPGADGSPGPSPRREGSFTTIDFPGSLTANACVGIDARGDIVGRYDTPDGVRHGYLLSNGVFTSIDFSRSFTVAQGINAAGDIVGKYRDAGRDHGYLLSHGEFTSFEIGEGSTAVDATAATGITPSGDIVGNYTVAGRTHGFLLSGGPGGSFDLIDYPGSTRTSALKINPSGDIVGNYTLQGRGFGYLLHHGEFTTIEFPGASQTNALGINPRGDIVGRAFFPDGTFHGYLLSHGQFTRIDFPGATSTSFNDINARGDMVGRYFIGTEEHGFVLHR